MSKGIFNHLPNIIEFREHLIRAIAMHSYNSQGQTLAALALGLDPHIHEDPVVDQPFQRLSGICNRIETRLIGQRSPPEQP